MANCCFVSFKICFANEESKNEFIKEIEKNISEANEKNIGSFLGSESRYLFDADVLDDVEISIKKENGKFFKTNDDFGLTEEITNEIINWFVSVC